MATCKFIITADDYGVTPIIDDAIEEAIEEGIITAVAAFPNLKDENGQFSARKVADLKKRHKEKISVGLHFTISSGVAVHPDRTSLTKKNSRTFRFFRKQPHEDVTELQIEHELWAQIHEFEATGPEIEHFSDHHGILSRTKVGLNAMIRVVNKYNEIRINQGRKPVPYRNPMFMGTLVSNKRNKLDSSPLATALFIAARGTNRRRKGKSRDILYTRSQLNKVIKDMQTFNIPTTDFFVESLFNDSSVETLERIFDTDNYKQQNLGYDQYKITRPLSDQFKTVEIMTHIAYGQVSGGYSRQKYAKLMKAVKDYGLEDDYMSYNRPYELQALKDFFKKYPEKKNLLTTYTV